MIILFLCKIHFTAMLAVDGTGQVIATVTYTFYFCHLTKHRTNLKLTFRTQTSFRNLIQIISYLHLHTITDILILLYTAEQLIEIILIRCMQQIAHHTKHTVSAFGKQIDFFSRL